MNGEGRRPGGSKARAPAENEIATTTVLAPNGRGPAKAYRHKSEKRRNIPPAAIAAEGKVPAAPKLNYSYSPRLDPILRFDPTGAPQKLQHRRPAGYWYKTERTGTAQLSLLAEEERDDLPLVNALRDDVRRWREAGYRGASHVTRDLLQ